MTRDIGTLIERVETEALLHDWMPYPSISETAKVCRACGIVRQRDGRNDAKPCRGKVRVTLRDALRSLQSEEPSNG